MGRWQRALIHAIEAGPRAPLVQDVIRAEAGRTPTRVESVDARRAAHTLAERGVLRLSYRYDRTSQRRALCVIANDAPEFSGPQRWRKD